MIVSDTGPIIVFARIDRLSLLRDVTGSLLIPDAVYDEIVVKKGGMPGAAEVAQAAWIQKASVAIRSIIDGLPRVLHVSRPPPFRRIFSKKLSLRSNRSLQAP